jgi:hypothetical protein
MPSTVSAPLRVYLDSNDISNLATNGLFSVTRKALKDLVATSLLELRFSYFHIVELAPTHANAKPFSLQRAALVEELCGDKAFLHTDKLHRYEALSLSTSRAGLQGACREVLLTGSHPAGRGNGPDAVPLPRAGVCPAAFPAGPPSECEASETNEGRSLCPRPIVRPRVMPAIDR